MALLGETKIFLHYPDVQWMKPNWGNGGVPNAVAGNLNRPCAAAAAANMGKLIVLLANARPDLADSMQEGVKATRELTFAALGEGSPTKAQLKDWSDKAADSLATIGVAAGVNQEVIAKYINNRFTEVVKGGELNIDLVQLVSSESMGAGAIRNQASSALSSSMPAAAEVGPPHISGNDRELATAAARIKSGEGQQGWSR